MLRLEERYDGPQAATATLTLPYEQRRRSRLLARLDTGEEVGVVTSGAPSPTLGKSIGLGYVPPTLAAIGSRFDVMVRGRTIRARVVETPFVRAERRPANPKRS